MTLRYRHGALAAAGLAGLLALAGCETTGQTSTPTTSALSGSSNDMMQAIPAAVTVATQRTQTNAPTAQIRDLPWLDGDVFDRQLSGALRQNPTEVRIDLDAPLSQMPARLNTWLNEVSERGGSVNTMTETVWARFSGQQTAEVQTRAAFLLQLLPLALQYVAARVREEATYGPSSNYDVIMVTNNQRNRTQLIVFRHKQAQ